MFFSLLNDSNFVFITWLWIILIFATVALVWGVYRTNHWFVLPWLIIVGNYMLMTLSYIIGTIQENTTLINNQEIISFMLFATIIFGLTGYCWLWVCAYYYEMLKMNSPQSVAFEVRKETEAFNV